MQNVTGPSRQNHQSKMLHWVSLMLNSRQPHSVSHSPTTKKCKSCCFAFLSLPFLPSLPSFLSSWALFRAICIFCPHKVRKVSCQNMQMVMKCWLGWGRILAPGRINISFTSSKLSPYILYLVLPLKERVSGQSFSPQTFVKPFMLSIILGAWDTRNKIRLLFLRNGKT